MSTTPFPLPIMLNAADRKALRVRAHHLDPVVMIGDAGLTRAVLDETDRALRAHELIKVRVLGDDRAQRQAVLTEICSALGCTPVQAIGKLLVLYRPRPIEDLSDAARRAAHVPKKRAAAAAGAPAKKRAPIAKKRAAQSPVPVAKKRVTRGPAPGKTGRSARGVTGAGGRGAAAGRLEGAKAMKPMKVTNPSASADKGAKIERAAGPAAQRPAKAAAGPSASVPATQGKRTAVGARARIPSRHGAPSAATQGPDRLQGRAPGATRATARARARKG